MSGFNVLDVIACNVHLYPNTAAIEVGGRVMSYSELSRHAGHYTRTLQEYSIGRGAVVTIISTDLFAIVPAMLGAMCAGRPFWIMDLSLPGKRRESFIERINTNTFIVSADSLDLFDGMYRERPEFETALVLTDATESTATQAANVVRIGMDAPNDGITPEMAADDMAYVFFTSGSTSGPKAVAGRYAGLSHFIGWELERFGVGPGTRVSQLIPVSFDPFLRDIFTPLAAGGTICAPLAEQRPLAGASLVNWLREQRINLIHCVPSIFRTIPVGQLSADELPNLAWILCAGEHLLPSDVAPWLERFGDRVGLANLYGPTETTLAKFCYVIQPGDQIRSFIPVGTTLPGTRAILLDADMAPVPAGSVGEVYIRTPYRSLGYYRDPEATATVFIPNVFNNDPNDLIYRTGDLGRLHPDGNLELLGRRDSQIKINGIRIAIPEIEQAIRQLPGIDDAAVVPIEWPGRSVSLHAYVVGSEATDVVNLSDQLRPVLPEVMIPTSCQRIDRLPSLSSGKTDRQELQRLASLESHTTDYVAPRTDVERLIANLWMQTVNVPRVGIHDNFFAIGGNSLKAIQLVLTLEEEFRVNVPLATLLENPNVEALSSAMLNLQVSATDSSDLAALLKELDTEDFGTQIGARAESTGGQW